MLGRSHIAAGLALLVGSGSAPSASAEVVLYRFTSATGGGGIVSNLVKGLNNALYGTTQSGGAFGKGSVFSLTPPAQAGQPWKFTQIVSFDPADGGGPAAGLAVDAKGNLYGTIAGSGPDGDGSVFRLSPPAAGKTAWTETPLHAFGGVGSGDGRYPLSPVIYAGGVVYGTAMAGGAREGLAGYSGVVYKLTAPAAGTGPWAETILHSFSGGNDGGSPVAGLARNAAGVLYGTTEYGGTAGLGTVFALTPTGSKFGFAVLHSFQGSGDGQLPLAGVVLDAAGNLYGTTSDQNSGLVGANGHGTIFELSPPTKTRATWLKTTPFHFNGGAQGNDPVSGLAIRAGVLYGTTFTGGVTAGGGNSDGNGVVFKLAPPAQGKTAWTETIIHDFDQPPVTTDGSNPTSGLFFNGENFLGTTSAGEGEAPNGVIYAVPQ